MISRHRNILGRCVASMGVLLVFPTSAAFQMPPPSLLAATHDIYPPLLSSSVAISVQDARVAQVQLGVFLMFGSGPLVSGINALPTVRKDQDALNALAGSTVTLGGSVLEMNALESLFLPESLRVKDVVACVETAQQNFPEMQEQMKQQQLVNPNATCAGSVNDLQAYVSRTVFLSSLKGCNPLTVECLFKAALSDGLSTAYVPVSRLRAKLEAYHQDDTLTVFKQDLAKTNAKRASGLVVLFLLMSFAAGFVGSSVVGAVL